MIVFLWFVYALSALVNSLPVEQAKFTALVSENHYDLAMNSLLDGEIFENDSSKGTVWFDTTSYELALYGYPLIGLYGITTETSYNYLSSLSELGLSALDNGYHGDFVYIMYRFLFVDSLRDAPHPWELLVREMRKGLNKETNSKEESNELLTILAETSSTETLRRMFLEIDTPEEITQFHQSLVLTAKKIDSW